MYVVVWVNISHHVNYCCASIASKIWSSCSLQYILQHKNKRKKKKEKLFWVRQVVHLAQDSVSNNGHRRCHLWDHMNLATFCSAFPQRFPAPKVIWVEMLEGTPLFPPLSVPICACTVHGLRQLFFEPAGTDCHHNPLWQQNPEINYPIYKNILFWGYVLNLISSSFWVPLSPNLERFGEQQYSLHLTNWIHKF